MKQVKFRMPLKINNISICLIMKRIFFFFSMLLFSTISFSQRYTSYGRGYDFGETDKIMNYHPSYWFGFLLLGIMLIGWLFMLYLKIDEIIGLKAGKYIKIISGGKICITSNFTRKGNEIVRTWKLEEFEHLHGQLKAVTKYGTIQNMSCTKDDASIVVHVGFNCTSDYFYNNEGKYRIALSNNSNYYLYEKDMIHPKV